MPLRGGEAIGELRLRPARVAGFCLPHAQGPIPALTVTPGNRRTTMYSNAEGRLPHWQHVAHQRQLKQLKIFPEVVFWNYSFVSVPLYGGRIHPLVAFCFESRLGRQVQAGRSWVLASFRPGGIHEFVGRRKKRECRFETKQLPIV